MPSLKDLNEQKTRIEAEIAEAKLAAIQGIRAQMAELGITPAEVGGTATGGVKRPIKYRHGEHTWTGVGQRPRWVRDALLGGATLDQFKVATPGKKKK